MVWMEASGASEVSIIISDYEGFFFSKSSKFCQTTGLQTFQRITLKISYLTYGLDGSKRSQRSQHHHHHL